MLKKLFNVVFVPAAVYPLTFCCVHCTELLLYPLTFCCVHCTELLLYHLTFCCVHCTGLPVCGSPISFGFLFWTWLLFLPISGLTVSGAVRGSESNPRGRNRIFWVIILNHLLQCHTFGGR